MPAPWCASLESFLREPGDVLAGAQDGVVAILQDNQPAFYVVSHPQWVQLTRPHDPGTDQGPAPAPPDAVSWGAAAGAPSLPSSLGGVNMAQLAERLVQQEAARVQRGELSAAAIGILQNRLDAHVLPHFGALAVASVGTATLDAFLQRLTQAGFSGTTMSQYFVIVRKLLKLALRQGLIREVPESPPIRIHAKPRLMLSLQEYAKVVQTALRLSRQGVQAPPIKSTLGQRERFWVLPRHRVLPPDMAWVIRFMVNSFVRPGDLRQLKHEHVQVCRGESLYLRLNLPATKRHDTPMVTLRPAVQVYESALRRARGQGQALPGDYVFLPEERDRHYALAVLGFCFKWVLREAGVPETDALGRPRTLYCLRHTAIMFRLLYGQGIDMLTLARNARTSVQMIERFYASALSGEMNVAMLQSRRAPRRRSG